MEANKATSEKGYFARITEDGQKQTLRAHTENTSKLARDFAESFNAGKLAEVAALYHDIGKATPEFQNYLFSKEKRGKIRHSVYGAQLIYKRYTEIQPVAELLANCISSHHGELRDFISPDGEAKLFTEMSEDLRNQPDAPSAGADADVLLEELKALLSLAPDKAFAMTMITKLLYSCLIDADRLDAYLFESDEINKPKESGWDILLKLLEKHLEEIIPDPKTIEMSDLRQSVSLQCAKSGLRERGIYQLSVPTGGGKTLSSLRFALAHARKHGMSRIIYVIPYLSILEQTAIAIRTALNADDAFVLEHHSNILPDDIEYYRLHTNRWDAPIMLTTQVQFMESVFSARGSDLRKFHNMTDSVIIFDEVQSLPVKCIHLFNSAVNFLNKVCNSTILLCTATQPILDKVLRPVLFADKPSIALYENVPLRTIIVNSLQPAGYTYTELAEFVHSKHNSSTLVIVNTKASAKALVDELRATEGNVLHLSTNMCPAHRDDVFRVLRDRLDAKEQIICVSTQLIESGVDISFECVIRDIAGLDSILQAAGRCNRHGEFGETKNVYVVNIKEVNLSKLPDIKIGADITHRLFDYDILDIDMFYQHYFYERRNIMDYPTNVGSIYDMLTRNIQGSEAFRNRGTSQKAELRAAIRSAADNFYIIAPGQTDVIVPHENAMDYLEEYEMCSDLSDKRRIMRVLGRYSVSLYRFQLEELHKRGALSTDDGIYVLSSGFYDSDFGVNLDGSHEFLYV